MFAKGNLLAPPQKRMLWNNVSPFKSCLFWVAMLVFKGVKQINQPDPIGSLTFYGFHVGINMPWPCMDGIGDVFRHSEPTLHRRFPDSKQFDASGLGQIRQFFLLLDRIP